jgi:acyl-coenzyme A synthetase/AMP-(fatty) acid ligase
VIANGQDKPEPGPVDADAETELMDQWMKRYGDDLTLWSPETHEAYAATLAHMRAGGAL